MKTFSKQLIFSGQNCLQDFKLFVANGRYSAIAVLVDENTSEYCLPLIKSFLSEHVKILVKSGEENKTINTCIDVWRKLSDENFDRKSLLINLGGGVLCDTGGYIASSYMRGIDFIHIPTTLLSMCDSCIGGKQGINMDNLKNQIGVFNNPKAIVIYPEFLKTLSERNIHSGFAEIIKHALVGDRNLFYELCDCVDYKNNFDEFIKRSIKIKTRIVTLDAFEKDIRKSLNFGHSIGHALESYFLMTKSSEPLSHGEAIAAGMIAESCISNKRKYITSNDLNQISKLINRF